MKMTNPKTGSVIQGEAKHSGFSYGSRFDHFSFRCLNCDQWADYRRSKPEMCPCCGKNPMALAEEEE